MRQFNTPYRQVEMQAINGLLELVARVNAANDAFIRRNAEQDAREARMITLITRQDKMLDDLKKVLVSQYETILAKNEIIDAALKNNHEMNELLNRLVTLKEAGRGVLYSLQFILLHYQ